jgi:hypothetical protein
VTRRQRIAPSAHRPPPCRASRDTAGQLPSGSCRP